MGLMIKLFIEEIKKELNLVVWNDIEDENTLPGNLPNPVARLKVPLSIEVSKAETSGKNIVNYPILDSSNDHNEFILNTSAKDCEEFQVLESNETEEAQTCDETVDTTTANRVHELEKQLSKKESAAEICGDTDLPIDDLQDFLGYVKKKFISIKEDRKSRRSRKSIIKELVLSEKNDRKASNNESNRETKSKFQMNTAENTAEPSPKRSTSVVDNTEVIDDRIPQLVLNRCMISNMQNILDPSKDSIVRINHITRKRTLGTSDHRLQEVTNKRRCNANSMGYFSNEENGRKDTGRPSKTAHSDSNVDPPVSSTTFSQAFDKWLISTSESNLIQTMTTSSKPPSQHDASGLLETAPSCSGTGRFHSEIAELDKRLERNKTEYRIAKDEAEMWLSEKKGLEQQLDEIKKRIFGHSAEQSKVSRFRRISAKGAKTGRNKKTAFYKFGAPYFKSEEGYPADHNEDLKEAIDQNEIRTILLPSTLDISNQDIRELKRNIMNQLKAKRIELLKELLKQLSGAPNKTADHEQLESNLRANIEKAEQINTVEEFENLGMSVDYRLLASYSQRFSSDDYERMWRLLGHPSVSKKAFSNIELEKLQNLANESNTQDWDLIARKLKTNRNGFNCFMKYMSLLRRKRNEAWTKEEDDLLRKLCSKLHSIRGTCARYHWWMNIRQQFPNRSYMQILDHWRYAVKPEVKKNRNTAEKRERANRATEEGTSIIAEVSNVVRTQPCVPSTSRLENLEKLGESNDRRNKDEENVLKLNKSMGNPTGSE